MATAKYETWKVHRCTDGSIETCTALETSKCAYGKDFYVIETNLSDAEFENKPDPRIEELVDAFERFRALISMTEVSDSSDVTADELNVGFNRLDAAIYQFRPKEVY